MIDGKVSGESKRFHTADDAKKFSSGLGKIGTVESIESKDISTNAPQLYKLSDIQVDAGKQFGYSPAKTLELVQSLYETHKIVSYPRTDGRVISSEKAKEFPEMLKAVAVLPGLKAYVDKITADDLKRVMSDKRIVNDTEVQKASHDALLPTGEKPNLSKLSSDELNICTMIYKRLLSVFLPPLKEKKTTIIVDIDGNKFRTTGKVLIDKGFTVLFDRKSEDTPLPDVKKGSMVNVDSYNAVGKTTTPPKRFTLATLIDAMENVYKYVDDKKAKEVLKEMKGIGTPASRAHILDELLKTGYMQEKGKGLYMTDTGKAYINNIKGFSIVDPTLAAQFETRLQTVREREATYEDVYKEVLDYVRSMVHEIDGASIVHQERPFGQTTASGSRIPSMMLGKKITEAQQKSLAAGKKVMIKGMTSKKTGKKFDAYLQLTDGKINFSFK